MTEHSMTLLKCFSYASQRHSHRGARPCERARGNIPVWTTSNALSPALPPSAACGAWQAPTWPRTVTAATTERHITGHTRLRPHTDLRAISAPRHQTSDERIPDSSIAVRPPALCPLEFQPDHALLATDIVQPNKLIKTEPVDVREPWFEWIVRVALGSTHTAA
jgi:hypothetical protein